MDLKLSDLIYKHENLIDFDDCDTIIREFKRSNRFYYEKSNYFLTDENKNSGGMTVDLIPNTDGFILSHYYTIKMIKLYKDYLKSFNSFYVDQYFRGFQYLHKYRLIKYKKDDFLHDHIDCDYNMKSIASCTLNLNDDYHGGDFRFFNSKFNLKLKKGDCLIFPASSFFVHGIEKILDGIRYSVNSFILSECHDKVKNVKINYDI